MTADDTIYEAQGYMDEDLHEADIVEWYETRPVTVSTAVFGAADPLAVTRSLADAVAAAWEADGGSTAYRLDAFA